MRGNRRGKGDAALFSCANYEVRTYAGWQSGTNQPTGPTLLSREDRPGSYSETATRGRKGVGSLFHHLPPQKDSRPLFLSNTESPQRHQAVVCRAVERLEVTVHHIVEGRGWDSGTPPTGRPTAKSAEVRQTASSVSGGVSARRGNDLPQATAGSTLRGSISFPRPRLETIR
jgi:hypothetical protein